MAPQGHYPGYDVMREVETWDDHTREIVKKRLGPFAPPHWLTGEEAVRLAAVAAALIDDERREILDYIVTEIDGRLESGIGESQRAPGVPPETGLMRRGLAALEETARGEHGCGLAGLPLPDRRNLLGRVERGELPGSGPWSGLPQPELFKKLLSLVVGAYYSHPSVWSEIGHGGPAYPRGYVRSELDLADPWEARRTE